MIWDFFKHFIIFNKEGSVVRRTAWLSIIGLSVSLCALVIVISVMNALNKNISNRMLSVEPHLSVYFPEIETREALQKTDFWKYIENEKESMVQSFSYFESQDVILRTLDGKFQGSLALGLEKSNLQSIIKNTLKIENIQPHEIEIQPGEIFVGSDLASSLDLFEGDVVLIFPPEGLLLPPSEAPKYERVVVKKIISSDVSDIDALNSYYLSGQTFKNLENLASRRIGMNIYLKDVSLVDQAKKDWKLLFPNLELQTWKDKNSAMLFALRLEKIMIGLFLSMAALVATLSMVSVLSLLISQKQKEISLLQSIGLSHQKVILLFRNLGLMTSICGIGSGVVIGTLVSLYMEEYPLNLLPDFYYDSKIPALVDWTFILFVIALAFVLSFVGSWFVCRASIEKSSSNLGLRSN